MYQPNLPDDSCQQNLPRSAGFTRSASGRLGIYTRTASTPVNTRVREGQESGSLGDTTVDLTALRRGVSLGAHWVD